MHLLKGLLMVPRHIDIGTLDLPGFHQIAPARITDAAILIICQNGAAVDCRGLAVDIQLLKGGLIDSQRSNTGFFCLCQHRLRLNALLLRQLHQVLIIHDQLNGPVLLLHLMTLYINHQGSQHADYNQQD